MSESGWKWAMAAFAVAAIIILAYLFWPTATVPPMQTDEEPQQDDAAELPENIASSGSDRYDADRLPIYAGFDKSYNESDPYDATSSSGETITITAGDYITYSKSLDSGDARARAANSVSFECRIASYATISEVQGRIACIEWGIPADATTTWGFNITLVEEGVEGNTDIFMYLNGEQSARFDINPGSYYTVNVTIDQQTGAASFRLGADAQSVLAQRLEPAGAGYSFSAYNRGYLMVDYMEIAWR